ncbi:helix-turn-helix domain-containing protein [Paenibacillus sp. LMG 31461]|uniref:Helix-turn-helix domain-containing protein n=1 Tax=Paenibacillus plantarum TaxID=2654975 RepID=A0ABX1X8P9_9BACL|nr:helix-turn-helix domain-containing protein [Paenibacillus plantarum]NOU64830.1 helix-turn-helix domain-containing protein [Paenibacillus plantarum]
MQKKWLYRLIMSYIPIFFAVIFCLMLLFFMTMSDMVRKQTLQANEVFAGQVVQILDSTLKNIDTVASKNVLLNSKITAYFNSKVPQSVYNYYEVTEVLQDFMASVPMIDSVYLYRESDGKIIMQHFSSELSLFGDRTFVKASMSFQSPMMWSNLRTLSLFQDEEQTKRVISLVKKVPYYSGEQGLIVINVRADSLHDLTREMKIDGVSSLCLADTNGNSFEGMERKCVNTGQDVSDDTVLKSSYTDWTLHIGMKHEGLFAYVSTFSYVWVLLGFMTIVGGIAAMTYISHRHYRPLDQVMNRISTFSEHKNSLVKRQDTDDEFAFIDKSLESLIEHTNNYDKLQAEGMLFRRAQLFKDILDGTRVLPMNKLTTELAVVGLDEVFDHLVVAVIEIDYYRSFADAYTQKDQSLFKFTLRSAVEEIAEAENEHLWTEWIAPHQLGLLYRTEGADRERQTILKIKTMAERARAWIEQYLTFTVTIGIANIVKQTETLPVSFLEARKALDRKISVGPNGVHIYDSRWDMLTEGRGLDTLQMDLREAAQLFRIGNPEWEMLLQQSFDTMVAGFYTKAEMTSLLRNFKMQLHREMQELPQEFQEKWRAGGFLQMNALADDFEWIGEAQAKLLPPLRESHSELQDLRMNREQYTLASNVQAYLSAHYGNPDVSLAQVSETFDVNTKTLSRIFKEEIGEKFVDYLARIRTEHAKQLLEETADPVQVISEKVGYLYPMSFIRVFKKIVGTTPGDYRKEYEERKGIST